MLETKAVYVGGAKEISSVYVGSKRVFQRQAFPIYLIRNPVVLPNLTRWAQIPGTSAFSVTRTAQVPGITLTVEGTHTTLDFRQARLFGGSSIAVRFRIRPVENPDAAVSGSASAPVRIGVTSGGKYSFRPAQFIDLSLSPGTASYAVDYFIPQQVPQTYGVEGKIEILALNYDPADE